MEKRIVIWARNHNEVGTVLDPSKNLELLEMRGELVTLPVEERLLNLGAIHGYFRRDWGLPGIQFAQMKPIKECPMLLWVTPEMPYLHFAARVVHDVGQQKKPRGVLRLASMANATGSYIGGISVFAPKHIELDELDFGPDPERPSMGPTTWILRGRVGISVQGEGFLSCCLNGVAEGVRVHWSAVTQSTQER